MNVAKIYQWHDGNYHIEFKDRGSWYLTEGRRSLDGLVETAQEMFGEEWSVKGKDSFRKIGELPIDLLRNTI